MKMRIGIACIALGAAFAAFAGEQASRKDDQAAIGKLQADWQSAWNKHDPSGMAAAFAEDGDLINPVGRVARGRSQVQRLYADEHQDRLKDSTYAGKCDQARFLSADIAVADCSAIVQGIKDVPGGTLHVLVTTVLVRGDGGWKIAAQRAIRQGPISEPARAVQATTRRE